MNLFVNTLLWGLVIGIIHYIVMGFLYQNPFIAKFYNKGKKSPAVKKWYNIKEYMLKMFLGTQLEIFILTGSYLYLRQQFECDKIETALILGFIFSCIRAYPRFWNMWIQTTYPNKLLVIELINGIIGTFIIILGLGLLPI